MNKTSFFFLLAVLLLAPFSLKAQNEHAPLAVDTTEIWIPSGSQSIFGVLAKPANPDGVRQPLAIVAHGFNADYRSGLPYFNMLDSLGYQCFTFDFPCGSVRSRSDSNTLNMSIIDEQQALEAVIDYFRRQPDIDPDRIVLIGESQGGLVSALVAANPANAVSRLILVYPALCIPDNWNSRFARIADIPEKMTLWKVDLGRRFFTELRYMRPFDIISQFSNPVLFVHGDADPVVPVEYSRRAAGIYPDAELRVIPGAGHGFRGEARAQHMEYVKNFLSK